MNARSPSFRVAHTDRAAFEKFFADTAGEPEEGTADANDSLWQIRALLGQDIGAPAQGAQDHLVNPVPGLEFAKLIHARTLLLESDCGHFAMLCEMDKVHRAVEDALH